MPIKPKIQLDFGFDEHGTIIVYNGQLVARKVLYEDKHKSIE